MRHVSSFAFLGKSVEITKPLRSPCKLLRKSMKSFVRTRDSNARPLGLRPNALPTELRCGARRRPEKPDANGGAAVGCAACREIFTLYAVREWLDYLKNGREIFARKLNKLSFELNRSPLALIQSELRATKVGAFNM